MLRIERTVQGEVMLFCMIVKLCALGPMSIFDARYLFYFFFVLLFLTSIIRSVAMHAFVREEGRHFICA